MAELPTLPSDSIRDSLDGVAKADFFIGDETGQPDPVGPSLGAGCVIAGTLSLFLHCICLTLERCNRN